MDQLDRILLNEETVQPAAGFATAVMNRVRQETRAPVPIPFPWRRLVAGLLAAAVVVVVGLLVAGSDVAAGVELAHPVRGVALRSSLLLLAIMIVSSLSAYLPMRWLQA